MQSIVHKGWASEKIMKKLLLLWFVFVGFLPCMAQYHYEPTEDTLVIRLADILPPPNNDICGHEPSVIKLIPTINVWDVSFYTADLKISCYNGVHDKDFFEGTAGASIESQDIFINISDLFYELESTMPSNLEYLNCMVMVSTITIRDNYNVDVDFNLWIDLLEARIIEVGNYLKVIPESDYMYCLWSDGTTERTIDDPTIGDYWCKVSNECDTVIAYYNYDAVAESRQEPWFSQFGSQVSLLEDGELEVYNALGQRLMGTREKEITIAHPGLYVLQFRSIEGVKKTAKVVIH